MITQNETQKGLSYNINQRELLFQRLTAEVENFREQLEAHPIVQLAASGALPDAIAREFARIQYVDSVLWIPMLALIKGRAKSPRLLKAVKANILCESGYDGIPHVTLCHEFLESIREPTFYGDYQTYAPRSSHPVEVMNGLVGMSEAEMTGWLLVAETLVPVFFKIFRPAFARIPGVDLRYLDEHISVDSDEHSQWMVEAAQEILERVPNNETENTFTDLLNGIRIGGRLTLSIPDVLYARALNMMQATRGLQ